VSRSVPRYAALLAGGQSRRMGRDKATLCWRGRTLLDHAADPLRQVGASLLLVSSGAGQRALQGAREVVDERPQHGPLGGLHAALRHLQSLHPLHAPSQAAASDVWLLLAACDTIGVQADWLEQLWRAADALPAQSPCRAVAFWQDPRSHGRGDAPLPHGWLPLPALYRLDALDAVTDALDRGELALWRLLDRLEPQRVAMPVAWFASVRGVNTPEDWARLQSEGQAQPPAGTANTVLPIRVTHCVTGSPAQQRDDWLAAEAPLQLRAECGPVGARRIHPLGTTLRTPGEDGALLAGWLWSEGLLRQPSDLLAVDQPAEGAVLGRLDPACPPPPDAARRHTLASAACGLCGRDAIEDVLDQVLAASPPSPPHGSAGVQRPAAHLHGVDAPVSWQVLAALPETLRQHQGTFSLTGGVHAAGLATTDGQLCEVAEDVGRHNAVDKLIGRALQRAACGQGGWPLHDRVLVLSGRIGFELVHKALRAGIPIVVAVGAPSSMAVDLADRGGLTLAGFVRGGRGNLYTVPRRVRLP
jgi:FdhD protein